MFSLILDKHAPVRNRRVSEKFSPWLTKDLKQLSATRDRLKKQAVRSKFKILMEVYRQTRNKVNKVNTDLKREIFTNKIASHNGDLKKTWMTINMVLNKKSKTTQIAALQVDGRQICDSESMAESMNEFLCSIGNTLSDKIPKTSNPLPENEYSVNPQNLRFEFEAINVSQLEKVFGKFKTSKGSGADGIANYFLMIDLSVIAESLCDIFNLSIATSVFPDSWKIARVAPIFISGQSNDRSNYRPISVLPFLSRVFEKLIYNQLCDYLDKNRLLFSKQSGFRSLHSVVTCLLNCTNDWYINMDKGQYTAMVFIDLKKAFDTVNHEILLKKLTKYGIIGLENTWFASYLENRMQFCRVNGFPSNVNNINCGVPQGSCLGPLLFLIYINDVPFSLQNSQVTMYADDTTISYSSNNIDDLNDKLNRDLNCLKQWLQGNKLSLDVIKTQAMVVGSRPNLKKISEGNVQSPSFAMGDSQIEIVEKTKYLGIQLDQHLVWDEHTRLLRAKVSRAIGFLKYAKTILPQETLSQIYRGIVEPHFRYCCSVWGSCGESRRLTLQKLQNRAARIVTNSSYDAPADALIQQLKWPNIAEIIKRETATIVYKSLNGFAPTYLSNIFSKNSSWRTVKLRNLETDLRIPLYKTSNGQKSF